jgi:general secretion pathway protein G
MSFASVDRRARGFSLIELVIVVVIIGIIAAIAIPRMSRGAAGAADSALTANLAVLRNALDLFQTEHGGLYPPATKVTTALIDFSNEAANDFGTKSATRILGPYLRSVPALPVGADKGKTTITDGTAPVAGFGWVYDPATGKIIANCPDSETDVRNVKYNTY